MKLTEWLKKRRRATLPSKQTYFQLIVEQSRVNGADYADPPMHHFEVPKDTWLQRKLSQRDG